MSYVSVLERASLPPLPKRENQERLERFALVCNFCLTHDVDLFSCRCRIHLFCKKCLEFDHPCLDEGQAPLVDINKSFMRAEEICTIANKILCMNHRHHNPRVLLEEAHRKGLSVSIPIPHKDGDPLGTRFSYARAGFIYPPKRYIEVRYKEDPTRKEEIPLSETTNIPYGSSQNNTLPLHGLQPHPDRHKQAKVAFEKLQELLKSSPFLVSDIFCLIIAPGPRCIINSEQSASREQLRSTLRIIQKRSVECLNNHENYNVVLVRALFSKN